MNLLSNIKSDILTITTASNHKPESFDKSGWWYAQLIWIDNDGEVQNLFESGQRQLTDNVELELIAVQSSLKIAADFSRPIELKCGNVSIVNTIEKFYPAWEAASFKRRGRKPIANLDIWHEINAYCKTRIVQWKHRVELPVDRIAEYNELQGFIAQQKSDNEFDQALRRGKL